MFWSNGGKDYLLFLLKKKKIWCIAPAGSRRFFSSCYLDSPLLPMKVKFPPYGFISLFFFLLCDISTLLFFDWVEWISDFWVGISLSSIWCTTSIQSYLLTRKISIVKKKRKRDFFLSSEFSLCYCSFLGEKWLVKFPRMSKNKRAPKIVVTSFQLNQFFFLL